MSLHKTTLYGDVMLQGGKFDTIGLFNINDVLHDTHGIVKDISFVDNAGNTIEKVSVKSIHNVTGGNLYILASLIGVDLNKDGDTTDPEDTNPMFMFRYDRLTKTARMIGDKLSSTSPFHLVFTTNDGSTDYWFRFNGSHFMLLNLNTLDKESFKTNDYVLAKVDAVSHPHKLADYTGGSLNAVNIPTYLSGGVMPNIMNAYRFSKNDSVINLRIPISPTMIACITITHGGDDEHELTMETLNLSSGFIADPSNGTLYTPSSTQLIDSTVLRSHYTYTDANTNTNNDGDDLIIINAFPNDGSSPHVDYNKYATITQLPTKHTLNATTSLKVTDALKKNTKENARLLFIRRIDSPTTSTLYLGLVCSVKNSVDETWSAKLFIDKSSFGSLDQTKGCLKLDKQDGFEAVIIFATDSGIHRLNYGYGVLYEMIDKIENDKMATTGTILPSEPNRKLFGVSSSAGRLEAYTNDPVRRVFIAKYQYAYATYHYDTDRFFVYPSTPLEAEYRADQYNALTGVLNVGDKAKALYDECFIDADIQNAGYLYLVNRVIALENNAKALEARVKALESPKESSS